MQDEQLELLVQRFLDGETTLEEETWLYDRFNSAVELPETLAGYADYFRDLSALASPAPALASPRPALSASRPAEEPLPARGRLARVPSRLRLWLRVAASVAAVALLLLGSVWLHDWREERLLAQVYDGSYVIVDGIKCDDLSQIKDSIRCTLAEAHRIERKVASRPTVEEMEQEVLEHIGDSAQRREIEQLLNE